MVRQQGANNNNRRKIKDTDRETQGKSLLLELDSFTVKNLALIFLNLL